MNVEHLRRHRVYWIGGSPCAGKSSMADLIASAHGLAVYHIDHELGDRLHTPDPALQPGLAGWESATWDDRWMRPVDDLLDEVIRCYQEEFDMALADLLAMPGDAPILVEGNSLLPDILAPLLSDRRRAIWVVATEAFQRYQYPRRGPWVQHILRQCSNPDQALQNWMDRDVAFAAWVQKRVRALGFPLLIVDGILSIEQNARQVVEHFGFPHD